MKRNNYIPHTFHIDDQQHIYNNLNIRNFDELIRDLPQEKCIRKLDLPDGVSDAKTEHILQKYAQKNQMIPAEKDFLGGGVYRRYIPAIVDELSSRSEFYTAYTPYQPEISQGTLTAIFEFQTYMARLTGMDIGNASLYDGATAMAEAMRMATRLSHQKNNKFLIMGRISPNYRQLIHTYNAGYGYEIEYMEDLREDAVTEDLTAVILVSPDFFGTVHDCAPVARKAKSLGVGVIGGVLNPLSLSLFTPPGEWGADIVFGEAQSLGNYPSFGGPALGFLTAGSEYVRHLPGRIVGETVDRNGEPGYVLTFQTREQHIRRERATSNICSNQGLIALRTTLYLSTLGHEGFYQTGKDIFTKTRDLKTALNEIAGVEVSSDVHFQDIVWTCPRQDIHTIQARMKEKGIRCGLICEDIDPYWENTCLTTVNELMESEDLDRFVSALREILE